jgi:LytS/YehU family sensor histidine kinase
MSPTRKYPPVWALVSAAWIGPAILAAFQTYMQARLGSRDPVTWRTLLWEGGDWLIYALLTPIVFQLAHRFPLRQGRLAKHIPIHLSAAIVLCGGWATGGALLRWAVIPGSEPLSVPGLASWFFTSLPFGVAVYFAVLGIQHAVFYFVEARERESHAARLSAQLADARLGALRMQMQPHFLFNSLNAITVIVRDQDTRTATRMLEQLGEMLHRVIRTDRPQEVPLAEELDFLRRFLAIEQVRFSDRLRPVFDIEPGVLHAAVPDFILQPLVENALRHGLAKRVTATMLRVAARRDGDQLVLSVEDDGPGPGGSTDSSGGVGLANTRERLATLYAGKASLALAATTGGGAIVTVRLPYRELVMKTETAP